MEAIVYEGSRLVARPELDIFSVPITDASVIAEEYQIYYPSSSVQDGENPIEFKIHSSGSHYLNLADHFVRIVFKVVNSDGSVLGDQEDFSVENNIFHTLFSSVEVFMNGKQISDSLAYYPYRAYLTNLLDTSESMKKNAMSSLLWYQDDNPDDFTNNSGYKKRKEFLKGSKACEIIGSLQSELLEQPRYIPAHQSVDIRLRRSPNKFCISSPHGDKSYKIAFESVELHVKKMTVHPQLAMNQRDTLNR